MTDDTAIIIIYVDSIVFIVGTAILIFGFKVNSNTRACSSATLLCLLCYMSIKVGHRGTTYSIHAKIIEVGMHPAEYLMPGIYFEMQFLYYYLVEKIVCPNSFNFSNNHADHQSISRESYKNLGSSQSSTSSIALAYCVIFIPIDSFLT